MAVAAALGAVAAGAAWFYRDPDRVTSGDPDVVVAPADGHVVSVGREQLPGWPAVAWRIAIFLSLTDVHVQRSPLAGGVIESRDEPGPFWPAFLGRSAANAGHWLVLETAHGVVVVHRVAGLIARRVTTSAQVGQDLGAGERIGRIVLGSRCELYLPMHLTPCVERGDRVRAGESVVARYSGEGST